MIRKLIYKLRYILIIGSALLGLLGASGTFGYTYYDIYPNIEIEINGLTYLCDENANCITTNGDGNTFNGFVYSQGSNFGQGRGYAIFYDKNNSGYLSQLVAYVSTQRVYSQTSPLHGCFGDYDKGIGDFLAGGSEVCNVNYNGLSGKSNANAQNTIDRQNDSSLAGKLESIRVAPFGVQLTICFNYGQGVDSFCFLSQDSQSDGTNYNVNFQNGWSGLSNLPTTNSSWQGSSGGGGLITDTGSFTNYDAILGYGYVYGFSENFCYGGYSLDNIFYPTENPVDFTGFEMGSGAYIYDIYNAYSGSYFTSASQFYQSFYSRYLVNNIASFYNYPKALYGIVERYAMLYNDYQTYDPNIGISKLVSYCELRKLDPSAEYTGGDISAIDGFNSLMGEITDKWRYYESGPLSLLSGEDQKLDSDKFFTFLSDSVINGFGDLSNKSSGIIPNYIIAVLLALVLFRMFSH